MFGDADGPLARKQRAFNDDEDGGQRKGVVVPPPPQPRIVPPPRVVPPPPAGPAVPRRLKATPKLHAKAMPTRPAKAMPTPSSKKRRLTQPPSPLPAKTRLTPQPPSYPPPWLAAGCGDVDGDESRHGCYEDDGGASSDEKDDFIRDACYDDDGSSSFDDEKDNVRDASADGNDDAVVGGSPEKLNLADIMSEYETEIEDVEEYIVRERIMTTPSSSSTARSSVTSSRQLPLKGSIRRCSSSPSISRQLSF